MRRPVKSRERVSAVNDGDDDITYCANTMCLKTG